MITEGIILTVKVGITLIIIMPIHAMEHMQIYTRNWVITAA